VSRPSAPPARTAAIASGVIAVQLLASVLLVAASGGRIALWVLADPPLVTRDGAFDVVRGAVGTFAAESGMLAVLLVTGVLLAATAVHAGRGTLSAATASTLHWIAVSQSLGITIVIVALMNGAPDASTIVALYALSAGAGLLGWLSDRTSAHDGSRAHLWPYAFLTVFAIVPWGVIALVQVTGLVVGVPASTGVRVVTLVVLAVSALWATAEWAIARPAGPARDPEGAARLRVLSSAALASIPAGAIIVLGLLGG
jgi:hypothetical protein